MPAVMMRGRGGCRRPLNTLEPLPPAAAAPEDPSVDDVESPPGPLQEPAEEVQEELRVAGKLRGPRAVAPRAARVVRELADARALRQLHRATRRVPGGRRGNQAAGELAAEQRDESEVRRHRLESLEKRRRVTLLLRERGRRGGGGRGLRPRSAAAEPSEPSSEASEASEAASSASEERRPSSSERRRGGAPPRLLRRPVRVRVRELQALARGVQEPPVALDERRGSRVRRPALEVAQRAHDDGGLPERAERVVDARVRRLDERRQGLEQPERDPLAEPVRPDVNGGRRGGKIHMARRTGGGGGAVAVAVAVAAARVIVEASGTAARSPRRRERGEHASLRAFAGGRARGRARPAGTAVRVPARWGEGAPAAARRGEPPPEASNGIEPRPESKPNPGDRRRSSRSSRSSPSGEDAPRGAGRGDRRGPS